MNTKLSYTRSLKNHLAILSNNSDLDWADTYLSTGEITVLANGLKNDVKSFVFPKPDKFVFVQILKEGEEEPRSREDARLAAADLLDQLEHYKTPSITVVNHAEENRSLDFVEGLVLGNYQFLKYFNDKKAKTNSLKEVKLHNDAASKADLTNLECVLVGTCKARDLVNEPHSYLDAPTFSEEVKAAGKEHGFKVKVLNKKQIEKLEMGGLLSVNQGSFVPPTFNIMEWTPKNAKNENPIVLVGKGVMFDTGGLSLKPTKNSMDFMKCDMGGSATVVGTMIAIAKANLPLNVVALVAATDNRPGNDAYVPGDIVKTMSGITVEVLNTDAEGRMTLADALHYAKRYNPELVLDFATLTGAASYCIGPEGICFMGNADSKIKYKMEQSGMKTHERLVEFPMWKEYGETVKSDIADIKNLGGPYAGHITAGKFLEHFVDYPWLHFDIAGPAYVHKKTGYKTKEGTGVGVRLTYDFLSNYLD
jgi:leucyl aminopeptidase